MSVIVAIREGDTVYMGADSQRSSNIRISRGFNESFYKITRFENGILAGFCGPAAVKQRILSEKDIFTLDEDGVLTKKHIVNSVIPKLIDNYLTKVIYFKDSLNLSVTNNIRLFEAFYVDKDLIERITYTSIEDDEFEKFKNRI